MTRQKRYQTDSNDTRSGPSILAMREQAGKLLGTAISQEEAADLALAGARTWRKFEDGRAHMPKAMIKLFLFTVALTALDEKEEKEGTEAVEKELGGPISIAAVFDYAHNVFEELDPGQNKERLKNG